jgi:hypothetical protein
MEAGTLQWDATLRVAKASANVPLQVSYTAPPAPDCMDQAGFIQELEVRGVHAAPSVSDPSAHKYQVVITKGTDGFTGQGVVDGGPPRTITYGNCNEVAKALALVYAVYAGLSGDKFGASGPGLVVVVGSQRVKFAASTSP